SMDGHTFERYVRETLISCGWDAEVTKGSGDQGVDVIAYRGVRAIAIQCKRYAQPAGNASVQEVHAGARHYGIAQSAVVATSGLLALKPNKPRPWPFAQARRW